MSKISIVLMILGGLWGAVMDMGQFILGTIIAGLILGNGIAGIVHGRIISFIGEAQPLDLTPIEKSEDPIFYWFIVLVHFVLSGMVIVYCIREFH